MPEQPALRARAPSPDGAHPRLTYLRWALVHPGHLLLLAAIPLALALGWPVLAFLVLGAAELALVALLPGTRMFRAWVDERLHAKACAEAALERARVLGQMTEPHRCELQRLEDLADRLRERIAPGADAAAAVEDYLGIDRLLATYARGAMSYHDGRGCLASYESITHEVRSLTEAARCASTPSARTLAAARLEIAQMRAVRWQRSSAELESIDGALGLIGDLVRLMYEDSTAPVCADSIREELRRALANAPEHRRVVRELTELLADGRTPDARTLRLGRAAAPPDCAPRPVALVHPPAPSVGPTRVAAVHARIEDETMGGEVVHLAEARLAGS